MVVNDFEDTADIIENPLHQRIVPRPAKLFRSLSCCTKGDICQIVRARKRNDEWDAVHVITEHALLPVVPGREDEFEIAFAEARGIITSIPGCSGLSLSRSIKSPSTFLLLVDWEHLEDHTIGFRQSQQYQAWRTLLHHFYEPFPLVEHYKSVP